MKTADRKKQIEKQIIAPPVEVIPDDPEKTEKQKMLNNFLHVKQDTSYQQNFYKQLKQRKKLSSSEMTISDKRVPPLMQRQIAAQLSSGMSSVQTAENDILFVKRYLGNQAKQPFRTRPQSGKVYPIKHMSGMTSRSSIMNRRNQEPTVTVKRQVTTDKSLINVAEVKISANVGSNTLDKLRSQLTAAGYTPKFIFDENEENESNNKEKKIARQRPMSGKPPNVKNFIAGNMMMAQRGNAAQTGYGAQTFEKSRDNKLLPSIAVDWNAQFQQQMKYKASESKDQIFSIIEGQMMGQAPQINVFDYQQSDENDTEDMPVYSEQNVECTPEEAYQVAANEKRTKSSKKRYQMYTKESLGNSALGQAAVRSKPTQRKPTQALSGSQRRALGSARRKIVTSTSGSALEAIRNIEVANSQMTTQAARLPKLPPRGPRRDEQRTLNQNSMQILLGPVGMGKKNRPNSGMPRS